MGALKRGPTSDDKNAKSTPDTNCPRAEPPRKHQNQSEPPLYCNDGHRWRGTEVYSDQLELSPTGRWCLKMHI